MDFNSKLQKYAKLAVKTGVNIQPGQTLLVRTPIECAEYVRYVVEEAYKAGAKEEAERLNIEKPIIVGVTVLTSLSNEDLQDIGCNMTTEELAIKRAKLAEKSGIDGVVCSAKEVDKIVEACGKDFVTVCPGIRPQSAAVGDQKRVVTPAQAIQNGAHYMVVGRPITQAENPKQSAIEIVKEIENA